MPKVPLAQQIWRKKHRKPCTGANAVETPRRDDEGRASSEENMSTPQTIDWQHNESIVETSPKGAFATVEQISRLLWLPSYEDLFAAELDHNRRLVASTGNGLQPSTYRARLRGDAAIKYDMKQVRRERDKLAIEIHSNNMRCWSPSLVARSISYFTLSSSWQCSVETRQRRLASKPFVTKVLNMMHDCAPKPDWLMSTHIHAFAFDQTYEWVGMKKRGHRQTVEQVDARGLPMSITHEVYVNSIKIALPASIGNLSLADQLAIAANNGSPYTEDYNYLFGFLQVSAIACVHSTWRVADADCMLARVSCVANCRAILSPRVSFKCVAKHRRHR